LLQRDLFKIHVARCKTGEQFAEEYNRGLDLMAK
jgi:hypothetical protein